jgi:putative FmdB family regulatory protein
MPLYVYTCESCEIELEELRPQSRADDPVECPVCHDLCVRGVTAFSVRRSGADDAPLYGRAPAGWSHRAGCACCVPRPSR